MAKIWIYLAIFALGNVTGLIIGVKLMGDQIHIEIKKVKNKRTTGTNTLTVPITLEPKKTWKQKREQRKLDKQKK